MNAMVDAGRATENKTARRLMSLVEEFQKIEPDLPSHGWWMFLFIAGNPDISMSDIQRRTGLASSTISRNIAWLGKQKKADVPGLNLVVAYEDPTNRRSKLVKLTPRGVAVYNSLVQHMIGG